MTDIERIFELESMLHPGESRSQTVMRIFAENDLLEMAVVLELAFSPRRDVAGMFGQICMRDPVLKRLFYERALKNILPSTENLATDDECKEYRDE